MGASYFDGISDFLQQEQPDILVVQEASTALERKSRCHQREAVRSACPADTNMRRKTNPGYATAVVDMMFVRPILGVGRTVVRMLTFPITFHLW